MKFQPHSYQRYCIGRLVNDERIALFLDMVLGKTVITLTAINDLKYRRFARRCMARRGASLRFACITRIGSTRWIVC